MSVQARTRPRVVQGLWFAIAALVAAVVIVSGRPTERAQIVGFVSIAVLLVHAVMGLGRREAGLFLGICLAVTFTIENIGVATGFPFGAYDFRVAAEWPRIGAIPLIVGPLYFGMGYTAWIMACLIAGRSRMRPDDRFSVLALPLIAAFATVQWDVVMDPPNATLWRAWVWHRGGGFFGVPLSNFFGWFLTVWLFFQLFAYALWRGAFDAPSPRSRAFWLVPILLYLASGLCHLPPWLMDADGVVTDGGGRSWSARDLRESTVVVMLFTMLPTGLLAVLRLYEPPAEANGTT